MKAKTRFSLKDQLFNPEKVEYLSDLVVAAYPDFASASFQQAVLAEFPTLELKERIAHISSCLYSHLPQDYPTALEIVLEALPPELDPTQTDDDFGDFIFAPLSLFVATYGCCELHLDRSLAAVKAITKRFSAEYAIRFFINRFPEATLAFLLDCAADPNYHVRRLASEGTRPKLPWAQKLTVDYRQPLPILEQTFSDRTRFVTRSVANHLNDISKLDPDLVIETLKRWQASERQGEAEMDFITRHAVRSLIKQGHPEALGLLGFGDSPNIEIKSLTTTTPIVKLGETFEFSLKIQARQAQRLLVNYSMQFATDGKQRSQKVFKLKQLELAAGEQITLKKRHPMRLMTTRRLVLGEHKITLHVNGQALNSLSFELVEAD